MNSNNILSKVLRIGIIVVIITILFVQMTDKDSKDQGVILESLGKLRDVSHALDKDILLVRSGLVRHYNRVDSAFDELSDLHGQLKDRFESVDDNARIKQLLADIVDAIKEKEVSANILKSDVGVLRNSMVYYSSLSNQITTEYSNFSSDSRDLSNDIRNSLISLNSDVIKILSNPAILASGEFLSDINELKKKTSKVNNSELKKNLQVLTLHLDVIYKYTQEVDTVLNDIIVSHLSESIDNLQSAYLDVVNKNKAIVSIYQNAIYLLSLILVLYSVKLVWEISTASRDLRKMTNHLKNQKHALDEHAIVSITDQNGILTEINESFSKVFGVESIDIVGKKCNLIRQNPPSNGLYYEIWNTISAGKVWSGEISEKSSNNADVWLSQTIVPFKDGEGDIYQYVCIATDITDRKKVEQDIEYQAYHDALTKLPNRRLLINRLEQVLSLCKHHNHYGCLMFIDLDRFKTINDSLGHTIGDALLVKVAERLVSCSTKEVTVSRMGGDEFVVLIPELADSISVVTGLAQQAANKIQEVLGEVFAIENNELFTTASIGISIFPRNQQSISDILQQADLALYKAKGAGKKCFRFFDDSMQNAAEKRLIIENDLRSALLNEEFKLYFQPQYKRHAELIGAEILLRWEHSTKGLISPADFIPVAEEIGVIIPIGDWIFETAFRRVKTWCDKYSGMDQCKRIAINVSPVQFMQKNFSSRVIELLRDTGVDPNRIELEITEGMLVENVDESIEKMKQLKAVGLSFSIDDFGTGYSSLSYLNKLPIETVKIDQSFVRDIHINDNNRTIVQTIIYMAKNLGMDVIAEGVECESELDVLIELGCARYQGYYFSKPVTSQKFEELLK